ncbi:MAG: hypothetical protein IPM52_04760 [Bacteroidetes bacterium]|nr:hypothetical protein [Bacteroidota bacterium]
MSLRSGLLKSLLVVVAFRLTGPAPGDHKLYCAIDRPGFSIPAPEVAAQIDYLTNNRSFYFYNDSVHVKFTFRNGMYAVSFTNFSLNTNKWFSGSYAIVHDPIRNCSGMVLYHTTAQRLKNMETLSAERKFLDFNIFLAVQTETWPGNNQATAYSGREKAMLKGFHTFVPRK